MNDPARISNLLDYQIWNLDRHQLGEVDDMVINLTTQHIDYILIQVGGLLSIGERLIPVPWNGLILQADQTGVIKDPAFYINVRKETLENAPAVEVDALSDVNNPEWDAEFRSYWNNELGEVSETEATTPIPQTDTQGIQGLSLAENLLEYTIQDVDDVTVGEIADLIIDTQHGEVLYALISAGGVLGIGERLIPVPLEVMRMGSTEGVLAVPVQEASLAGAPSFDPGNFPNASATDWDAGIRQYWESLNIP